MEFVVILVDRNWIVFPYAAFIAAILFAFLLGMYFAALDVFVATAIDSFRRGCTILDALRFLSLTFMPTHDGQVIQ